jgi:hypothetical protein
MALVLAVIAFSLTRAAATLSGTTLARATTATIRRTLIGVPARVASSARRLTLHLPLAWPWQHSWTKLFTHTCRPPATPPPEPAPSTAQPEDPATAGQTGGTTTPEPSRTTNKLNCPRH